MTVLTESTTRPPRSLSLVDGCGRSIDHLRLSVTSVCDLRCAYCRPDRSTNSDSMDGALRDEQRLELVQFLHERYGFGQVRLTGGEPLLHRGIVTLVAKLRDALPDVELAMTTNGRLLYHQAFPLFHAGLDRLNISLDSLRPRRYRQITGGDIDAVLNGIESARCVGFRNLRINTVVLRGVNDDEIMDLAAWTLSRDLEVRFLEAMPIGPAAGFNRRAFVPGAAIEAELARGFRLEPLASRRGETARRFRATVGTHRGVIGLITPVTEPFCGACRRMRVTAEGLLYPCLLDPRFVDMRPAWSDGYLSRRGADAIIRSAVGAKRAHGRAQATRMADLGG